MSNNENLRIISVAVFSVLFALMLLVTIVTFTYTSTTFPPLMFLVKNHFSIMIITVLLSIGYGFFWAQILQRKVQTQEQVNQKMFTLVMQLLSSEEKAVLKHLQSKQGHSTQSNIAHVHNMGGVKAMRTVQKLQTKGIVTVEKEGKVRRISLNKEFQLES